MQKQERRMGCLTCNIYLCSPECIEAHLYDSPEIIPARGTITFNAISAFKEKKKAEDRAHPSVALGKKANQRKTGK